MSKIIIKEILIYDKSNNLAKLQSFKNGINIITSENNGVGKTSLSKLILYAFGAKISISDNWNKLKEIFTRLTILCENKEIVIIRHKDNYKIQCGKEIYTFSKQEKFNDVLYELIGFTIKIKEKNSENYITAVPSVYLLPNYIAQLLTFDEISIFEDLKMYEIKDVRDSLYYHVGTLDENYIKIIVEISKKEENLELLKEKNNSLLAEIKYLNGKLEENKNIIPIKYDNIDSEVKLYNSYLFHKKEYYNFNKELFNIQSNISLLKQTKQNNDILKSELKKQSNIVCPQCGYDLSSFIEKSFKINASEEQITQELITLSSEMLELKKKIERKKVFLDNLESQIKILDKNRENEMATNAIIVWKEELIKSKLSFSEIQLQIDELEKNIKLLKMQKNLYNEKKKNKDNQYRQNYIKLLKELNVCLTNLDISKLTLFQKPKLEGSEIPRANIASCFAMQEVKENNALNFPIMFDFPNLDMTEDNISKCFKMIFENIINFDKYPQSFIFSIHCLNRMKKAGVILDQLNIIDLDGNTQLLNKEDFVKNLDEIKENFS